MTVEVNDTVERYTISGVGPYPFSFRVFDEDEIAVVVDTGDVDAVPLTITTHYTVAGVNDRDGGTVTLTSAAAAAYAGDTLDIRSNTTEYQPTSIRNQGSFLPALHEEQFDRLARQVQDLSRRVDSKFGYPDSVLTNGEMSPLSAWAGKYPFVNSDGEFEPAEAIALTTLTKSVISALLNPQTVAEAGSPPVDFYFPVFFVSRYYDPAHGTDYSIATQAAVNAAAVNGGTVEFDNQHVGRWGFSAQVTVSSLHPINILGHMNCSPNANEEQGQYIAPNNNISGDLIKYESPTASPNEGGGGIIRGLSFFDDSDPTNVSIAARRVKTMNAALGLDSFALSKVENCYFHYIKGSAIRVGFSVMSDYVGNVIRYCGNTGLPAFNHPADAAFVMQSCSISRCRLEVNFDAPYIYIHNNTNTQGNKLTALGFESETAIAATSQRYIDCAASSNTVSHCHFHRIGATYAVRFSGNNNELIHPQTILNDGGLCEFTGNKNTLTGGQVIAATSTIPTIVISGQDGTVNGTTLYFANKIELTGVRAQVLNSKLIDCTTADYLITATASGFDISHVEIVNTNSVRAVSPSGISVSTEGKIAFCRLLGNAAATGINVNSANVQCVYNTLAGGHTTAINPNGHMADSWIENNIGFVTEAKGTSSIASGNTNVDVTHGLAYTPVLGDIHTTFSQQATNDYGRFWISNITSTQFRLNVSADPGASGLGFGWSIAPR